MIRLIYRLVDTVMFALERLVRQRWLVLWALLGLTAATTLALSLPLYSDAVNSTILASKLNAVPYAFRFRYLGSWKGNISQADVKAEDSTLSGIFAPTVGLPVSDNISYLRTSAWTTMRVSTVPAPASAPVTNSNATNSNSATGSKTGTASGSTPAASAPNKTVPLSPTSLGLLNGLDKYITIAAGAWPPKPADLANLKSGDPLPVAAPETMLNNMGVQVGDVLQMSPAGGTPLKVKVAALWRATNTNDLIWNFYPPKAFDAVLLMPTDLLWQTIGKMNQPVEEAAWYLTFDGHNVRTEAIDSLLGHINNGTTAVYQALPGIRVEISPVDGLNQFNAAAQQLTLELAIIVLPVGGLVLYFVALIAGLLVRRQNQEDVTLGSRGLGRRGILGIHATMWLILAGSAFALGIILSPPLVNLVGRTTSFLRFDNPAGALTAVFTPTAIEAGIVTALLAASSGLYAAWRTTRNSITSYKVEAARARPAWWQRIYLDFLLLIPAYYVLYTLEAKHGAANTGVTDPFADPLTFLGPTLFTLGHTLLFLRLWPIFMRIGANLLARGRSIASLMALRELTRSIGRYRGSLLMMAFTLSLAGFTASMAGTLDSHLRDQISYSVGADVVIVTSADAQTTSGAPDATTGQTTETVTGYNVLPVDDLRTIPGVAALSRVGHYDMQLMLPKGPLKGTAYGVDRDTMAEVTRYRADYSSQPLADLFNRLAANPTGIIISQKMAVDNNLRINQTINYQLYVFGQWREQDQAPIVGIVNYFPTIDPRATPFIITSLDPIFDLATTYLQYDVWMALQPGADPNAIVQKIQDMGYPVVTWKDADQQIFAAETAPDRRGILGFLSVGFVASIVLTLVGNIVQSASSFQAQSFQLGSLRAMGLGGGAVGRYLILSQGLAVLSGIAGGTVIGAVTTLLFLPLLDFGGGLPPYLVHISWTDLADVYIVFAGVLLFVTLMMTFLLSRERLANVVKLGDAM